MTIDDKNLDPIQVGNNLHNYYFNILNKIYDHKLIDTGFFKHPFIPDFLFNGEQRNIYFYIRYSFFNLAEEMDSLSEYNLNSFHEMVIIFLEKEKYPISSKLWINRDILVVFSEAIESLNKELKTEDSTFSFFRMYCKRIFEQTGKVISEKRMEQLIKNYKLVGKKSA